MRDITDQFKSIAKIALRNQTSFKRLVELVIEAEDEVADAEDKFPFYPDAPAPHDEQQPVSMYDTLATPADPDQDTEEFDAVAPDDTGETQIVPPLNKVGVCFVCGGHGGTHKSWCQFNRASPTYSP